MDYAKYAYIKAKELEEEYNTFSSSGKSKTVEFVNPVMNMQLANSVDIALGQVNLIGDACFQLQIICKAQVAGSISIELLLDGVAICSEQRNLIAGENSLIITKAYTTPKECIATFTARVSVASASFACTLCSSSLVVWGNIAQVKNIDTCNICALGLQDQTLVSYCDGSQIYVTSTEVTEKSFLPSDFTLVAGGVSHCFALNKATQEVYFFRVDMVGDLYYQNYTLGTSETRLDTGVSWVSARECPAACTEDMLICYIKNGDVCFRCMTGNSVGSLTKFNLPAGSYNKVEIADAPTSRRMYVICTHSNGSNYILMSQEEVENHKCVEHLQAQVGMLVYSYSIAP